MTLNYLHIISNLIVNQNFENFKLGKHTKLNLYDVKDFFLEKSLLKAKIYFALPQVVAMGPHK